MDSAERANTQDDKKEQVTPVDGGTVIARLKTLVHGDSKAKLDKEKDKAAEADMARMARNIKVREEFKQ